MDEYAIYNETETIGELEKKCDELSLKLDKVEHKALIIPYIEDACELRVTVTKVQNKESTLHLFENDTEIYSTQLRFFKTNEYELGLFWIIFLIMLYFAYIIVSQYLSKKESERQAAINLLFILNGNNKQVKPEAKIEEELSEDLDLSSYYLTECSTLHGQGIGQISRMWELSIGNELCYCYVFPINVTNVESILQEAIELEALKGYVICTLRQNDEFYSIDKLYSYENCFEDHILESSELPFYLVIALTEDKTSEHVCLADIFTMMKEEIEQYELQSFIINEYEIEAETFQFCSEYDEIANAFNDIFKNKQEPELNKYEELIGDNSRQDTEDIQQLVKHELLKKLQLENKNDKVINHTTRKDTYTSSLKIDYVNTDLDVLSAKSCGSQYDQMVQYNQQIVVGSAIPDDAMDMEVNKSVKSINAFDVSDIATTMQEEITQYQNPNIESEQDQPAYTDEQYDIQMLDNINCDNIELPFGENVDHLELQLEMPSLENLVPDALHSISDDLKQIFPPLGDDILVQSGINPPISLESPQVMDMEFALDEQLCSGQNISAAYEEPAEKPSQAPAFIGGPGSVNSNIQSLQEEFTTPLRHLASLGGEVALFNSQTTENTLEESDGSAPMIIRSNNYSSNQISVLGAEQKIIDASELDPQRLYDIVSKSAKSLQKKGAMQDLLPLMPFPVTKGEDESVFPVVSSRKAERRLVFKNNIDLIKQLPQNIASLLIVSGPLFRLKFIIYSYFNLRQNRTNLLQSQDLLVKTNDLQINEAKKQIEFSLQYGQSPIARIRDTLQQNVIPLPENLLIYPAEKREILVIVEQMAEFVFCHEFHNLHILADQHVMQQNNEITSVLMKMACCQSIDELRELLAKILDVLEGRRSVIQ